MLHHNSLTLLPMHTTISEEKKRDVSKQNMSKVPEVEVVWVVGNALQEPSVSNGLHVPIGFGHALGVMRHHSTLFRAFLDATWACYYPVD